MPGLPRCSAQLRRMNPAAEEGIGKINNLNFLQIYDNQLFFQDT
jgi:hypothetical protein